MSHPAYTHMLLGSVALLADGMMLELLTPKQKLVAQMALLDLRKSTTMVQMLV
jgi:hypothetical protein